MRFVFHPEYVSIAFKSEGFTASLGGVGPAPPPGVLAFCAAAIQERYFSLFLYDEQGNVTTKRYPFAEIPITDGGPDGMTRIDVTGSPVVVVHDGVVKCFYANYRGTQPAYLMRFNTGWRLE